MVSVQHESDSSIYISGNVEKALADIHLFLLYTKDGWVKIKR